MRQSGAVPLTAALEAVSSPLSENRTQEDLPCAILHSEGDGGAHRARTRYRATRKREKNAKWSICTLYVLLTLDEPKLKVAFLALPNFHVRTQYAI